jgi:regulator of sigma E protease
MLTIIAFIFTLGILVTVHEYGHFQVAKWVGVKVLKFSIGFGKPIWTKKFGRDGTELVIAAIPLGGYVKMLDERELVNQSFSKESTSDVEVQRVIYSETDLKRAFNRQSVCKRIAIVLAGPSANLLLAILLYWFLFMMGVVGMKPIVGKVVDRSPAAEASFAIGDTIKKINSQDVATWQDVIWKLLNESLKHKSVEVATLNSRHELHIHQLNISNINSNNSNKDILGLLGLTAFQPEVEAIIGVVTKNSPAENSGLLSGDRVININHIDVKNWEDFVREVQLQPNEVLNVTVQRNAIRITLSIKPESVIQNGKSIGRIGAGLKFNQNDYDKLFVTTQYSAVSALLKATEKTWEISIFSLKMMVRMVTGEASWKGISGPVTIASYAGQSANMGLKVFVGFLAMISISIGVLNLLPIPVLDGGHLMYYMVEIFTGKQAPESVMMIGQKIGLTLLGFMMILAFYNDINRIITG